MLVEPDCISPAGATTGFLLSGTAGSKAPYTSALFALNFSIPSVSHARGSGATSALSFFSHESGSLKMFSAMALPGTPKKEEVNGVDESKGESRTSRSG